MRRRGPRSGSRSTSSPPPRRAGGERALRRRPRRPPRPALDVLERADVDRDRALQPDRVDRPILRRCAASTPCSARRRDRVVAVSPIVAGAALKGPADRMLAELGLEASVVGVARLYAPICGTLVMDRADDGLVAAVERDGVQCVRDGHDHARPRRRRCARQDVPRRGGMGRLMGRLTIWAVEGIGEIRPGDQLGEVVADACAAEPNGPLADGDVLVVTQKVVSQGRGPDGGDRPRRSAVAQGRRRGRGGADPAAPRRPGDHRDPSRLRVRQQRRRPLATSSGAGPRCCRSTATARPAASATSCGPGSASPSASSCPTPSGARGDEG